MMGSMAAGVAEVVAAVVEVGSARQFEELLHLRAKSFLVVHFWAPWTHGASDERCGGRASREHSQVSIMKKYF